MRNKIVGFLFLALLLAALVGAVMLSTAEKSPGPAQTDHDDVAAFLAELEEKKEEETEETQIKETESVSLETKAEKEEEEPAEEELTCTLSVRCDTALQNLDRLQAGKESILPANGVIFPETKVVFYEGESVFNLLVREMKKHKIHMEFVNTPLYNSAYIEGIGNLYEFDCGELSGWMYSVNGQFPNYGASGYLLSAGDKVVWQYTCDLGQDIGGGYAPGNGRVYENE